MPLRRGWGWLRRWRERLGGAAPDADDGVHLRLAQLIALRQQAIRLRLVPQRAAGSPLPGGYRALFRGRGMDFEEVREYQPGDEVRSIHWLVTARTGRAHAKLYREERERSVFLLIDLRRSMFFGTRSAFKSVVAARLAAVIAWAAAESGDRVGGLIFSEAGWVLLRPLSGRRGALRLLKALVDTHRRAEDDARGPDFARALQRLRSVAHPGAMVVVVSDFYEFGPEAERQLARLAHHTDVLGAFVYDPLEAEPPPPGRYVVSDGRRMRTVDAADADYRSAHRARFRAQNDRVVRVFTGLRLHLLRLSTGNSLDASLRRLLQAREHTRRGLLRGAG